MNITTEERLTDDYQIYAAIEEAVTDKELDFTDSKELQDFDPDLYPHLQKPTHMTTALALMRRHKQDERLDQLAEIYPAEYAASDDWIWPVDKVTRNHLMANELRFLKIDPYRLKLIPEAFYEIKDKKSKAYGQIRPLFIVPDEVILTAFFILPPDDQFSAIEQAERETLSAKIIELLTTFSKEFQWPVSDQFRKPFRWTEPGPEPSTVLHNAVYNMQSCNIDTYVGGHLISDYIVVSDHQLKGVTGCQPVNKILEIAESMCMAYARELTVKTYTPSPEEQEGLQEEADLDQAEQSGQHEKDKTAE